MKSNECMGTINKVSAIMGSYSHVVGTKLPPLSCHLTGCMNLGRASTPPKFSPSPPLPIHHLDSRPYLDYVTCLSYASPREWGNLA